MVRRSRNLRRRSSTPNLKLLPAQMSALQTVDPTSPPDTPIASPLLPRKKTQSQFYLFANTLAQDPNIKPYGNGHQFSYRPVEQLSPRSSSSSSDAQADPTDDASSESASVVSLPNAPPQPQINPAGGEASQSEELDADVDSEADSELESDADSESESESEAAAGSEAESEAESNKPAREVPVHATTPAPAPVPAPTEACDFTIEDVDPMDSDCEGLDVLFPTEIESNRSRSRSRHKDLDKGMMQNLKNLNCSNETSDNEGELGLDEIAFIRRQQELKRIRRVSVSSSFGKRTHSELSDSDDNDGALDVNEVGSSARRFRKRLHRGSLLFQDPPAPRIDELEEPNSSDDEYANELRLAQELPYYTMEIMETDSN